MNTPRNGDSKLIFTILAFIAVVCLLLWPAKTRIDAGYRQQLVQDTDSLIAVLKNQLGNDREYLGMLARRAMYNLMDAPAFEKIATRYLAERPAIGFMAWLDADARLIAVAPEAEGPAMVELSLSREDALFAANNAAAGKPVFSDPFQYSSGEPGFLLYVPILKENEVTGYLAAAYLGPRLLSMVSPAEFSLFYRIEMKDRSGIRLALLNSKDGPVTGLDHTAVLSEPRLSIRLTRYRQALEPTIVLLLSLSIFLVSVLLLVVRNHRVAGKQRREMERALRESRDRYHQLVDHIDVGIALVDANRKVIQANAAMGQIYGIEPETFTGQELKEEVPWPKGLQPIEVERDCRRADGTPFTGLIKVFPLLDEQGKVVQYIEMVQDITNRKQALEERLGLERRIQSAQKLESLGIMAGGIAHDFNNLLMGVLGNADLALLHSNPTAVVRENLQDIRQAARRAAELCKQMLAFSGKGRFVVEIIDLSQLIEEMAHLLQVSALGGTTLEYQLARGLPPIDGDVGQIRQVVMNLVTNAAEAMNSHKGEIKIVTSVGEYETSDLHEPYLDKELPSGTYVTCDVIDNGMGMKEETREKVFDPFFTTKFTGRGLGMAAVLGIIRGHQGAVKIYSEPDKGTTVRFFLPTTRRKMKAVKEVDAKLWRGSGIVLLVDDDHMVRHLCMHMLEHLGFQVLVAEGGRRALQLFTEQGQNIVCVILDLAMPDMDGEETFRALRRIRENVRVLLASGFSEQEVAERFQGLGLSGFIQKPFQIKELAGKLNQILNH
ncbi:MAG: response regulator [Acidobacteriota bacterium]|nr:response regulator [Acidobacteriota bacterium]